MSITIDLSPADIQLVQEQATVSNVSIEQYSREAIMKTARNAAYLAKIDRAHEQMQAGTGKRFTLDELGAFINGDTI